MPGCIVSATTASFRSVEKRRLRATPVITSTFENVSDIGVYLGLCLGPPAKAGVRSKQGALQIVAKLRQVDVLTSQGQGVAEAIRSIGISEVTYYRWRQEFGGLKNDQVKRLKELEAENTRLRRAISDLTLDKLMQERI